MGVCFFVFQPVWSVMKTWSFGLGKKTVPGKSTDSSQDKMLIGEISPDRGFTHAHTRHVLRVPGR